METLYAEEILCAEDMAVRDDIKTYVAAEISKAINEAIKSFEPHGLKKAAFWLRQLGPTIGIIAVCVAVVGVLIAATSLAISQHTAATTRLANEAAYEAKTDGRLGVIETQLVSLRALVAANQPLRPQNQTAAKELLAEATKKLIPPIPEPVVEQAGKSFIEAAQTEPKAWNVVVDFLNYRSSLNTLINPPRTGTIQNTKQINDNGKIYAFGAAGCLVPYSEAARFTHLSHPTDETIIKKSPSVSDWSGCRWFILGDINEIPNVTQDVDLDDHIAKNIVFIHVHIHYHGGPMELENVYFLDCYFEIDINSPGINLSEQLLAASPVSLKKPV